MLHRNGELESISVPLEPSCCARMGRWSALEPEWWRWNPPVRWNRNAAQEWGAGINQCAAGTVILHRTGALESTTAALEPQCCIGVRHWNRPVRRWNRDAA